MRVLDLFAGLEGWSRPFRERGHKVFSTDLDRRFPVDLHIDVMELTPEHLPWRPDIILASPPCEGFTVMNIGKNWTRPNDIPPHAPKTPLAWQALKLVQRTRWLIDELAPSFFVIENPRAKLRKLPVMADLERRTVTYCHYGLPTMKPTDLWGGFPPSLELELPCKNGDPCHVRAPRGSRTPGSIQGVGAGGFALQDPTDYLSRRPTDRPGSLSRVKRQARDLAGSSDEKTVSAIRAQIPYLLALAVCRAAESDLGNTRASRPAQERLFG